MKFFSGTSNPALSQKISQSSAVSLSKSEVVRFANSEIRVTIQEEVKDEICYIIQSTSNPTDTHLMELFFFCDALKRGEAKKIYGIIPYFGYARQNIQHRGGEAVSANVIIKFLETVGFDEILTFDLHDEATAGIFTIPFKSLSAFPILAEKVSENYSKEEMIVVSPDQAGVERARIFAKALFGNDSFDMGVVEKKRDLDHPHQSKAVNLFAEVKDKVVVLVDDIVTSGGTLINAANLCLEKGAKKVIAAVTHHDFSQEVPKLIQESKIEKFYTTDTIVLQENQKFEKLGEVSVAPLISEEIKSKI